MAWYSYDAIATYRAGAGKIVVGHLSPAMTMVDAMELQLPNDHKSLGSLEAWAVDSYIVLKSDSNTALVVTFGSQIPINRAKVAVLENVTVDEGPIREQAFKDCATQIAALLQGRVT